MSMNLGTYALISALALGGGAVAQHQYNKPAGPPQNGAQTQQMQQDQVQPQNGYSSTPMGSTGVVDCNTLMTHHQQMMDELKKLDDQLDTRVSQMHDAKSDRAKLDATIGVVDELVTQRKQMRDRMMSMEHETIQFLVSNKGTDLTASCPQLTLWLQQGARTGVNTDDSNMQGGPDDMELGNDNNTPSDNSRDNNRNNNNQR